MEKQNVGTGIIYYKLCYYNGSDDVYAACGYYGWNTCLQCIDFDFDTVFW